MRSEQEQKKKHGAYFEMFRFSVALSKSLDAESESALSRPPTSPYHTHTSQHRKGDETFMSGNREKGRKRKKKKEEELYVRGNDVEVPLLKDQQTAQKSFEKFRKSVSFSHFFPFFESAVHVFRGASCPSPPLCVSGLRARRAHERQ